MYKQLPYSLEVWEGYIQLATLSFNSNHPFGECETKLQDGYSKGREMACAYVHLCVHVEGHSTVFTRKKSDAC